MRGGLRPRSAVRGLAAESFVEDLLRSAAAVATAAVVSAALVLAMRRLTGGLAAGNPALAWMALGAGAVLLVIADAARPGRRHIVASLAARIALVVAIAAIAPPSPAGGWTSALPTAAAIGVGLMPVPGRRHGGRAAWRRLPPPRRDPTPQVVRHGGNPPPSRPLTVDAPAGRLQQRLERYEAVDGSDCLSGHVRLAIPAGGKTTHAHVGFCPAFAATPTVQVTTDYDGVEAVVAAAEIVPWGVRIECRLSEPAEEPIEIPVDVIAKAPRT